MKLVVVQAIMSDSAKLVPRGVGGFNTCNVPAHQMLYPTLVAYSLLEAASIIHPPPHRVIRQ